MFPSQILAPPAAVSEADAARLARELYGLEATARRLPGEHDDNFHLRVASGEQWVFKVMAAWRERGLVELQAAALAHLESAFATQASPGLALPRVVPSRAGEAITVASLAGEERPGGERPREERQIWMLTWVPGNLLVHTRPRSAELLDSLGRFLGRLDVALASFHHPAARRDLPWDLARAGWVREHLAAITDPGRRALVERFLALYEAEVVPALAALPCGVIHGDANDYNVLVDGPRGEPRRVASLIDFGDMHESIVVAEPAVAAAYALFGERDPLAAVACVVTGYHAERPLAEAEIAVLFPLVAMRLVVSVVTSALRKAEKPGDPYVTVSEQPAWEALGRLAKVHPRFAHYSLRAACGLPPVPSGGRVTAWLAERAGSFAPVVDPDPRSAPSVVLDLSVGSLLLGADPKAVETAPLTETIWREMRRAGATIAIGRYDEPRLLYTTEAFASGEHPVEERRTIHLGLDFFVEAGAPVKAPLAGTVCCVANNAAPKDYGPLVILRHAVEGLHAVEGRHETAGRHEIDAGDAFFTLYGHLDEGVLEGLRVGQAVAAGEVIGRVGAPPRGEGWGNGDWPPHLHLQVILDLLELDRESPAKPAIIDFPGVALPSQRAVWTALSPDPNLLAGVPAERFPPRERKYEETLAARRAAIGGSVRLAYRRPLKIVRGFGSYLYDEVGRAYLDVYNNVPHVGHSHPRVVEAAARQLALLNTNTRYLHDAIARYAERLTALLPEPLSVCFFLNSGSEANELALRLARAATGGEELIVLDAAYHGHTTALIDASPYKFEGPGGAGRKPWVHVAPIPDDFRGPYKRHDPRAGEQYARHVGELAAEVVARGGRLAGFLGETVPSVGGQIVPPPGYLAAAYRQVREAGGLAIADEVQVGFGRLGSHFWGFEMQGAVPDVVVPDIVVLGKPIGNGIPLAAVVTTREIAAAFDNGMELFSTFGGNPVACAAGLAVLDVLEEEGLQENARRVGGRLLDGLRGLVERHPAAGDARGRGLFLGLELVRDRETLEPAAEEASYVVNRLRELGILAGTDGPFHNVIKIRPPMCLGERDADHLVEALDRVLGEDPVRRGS